MYDCTAVRGREEREDGGKEIKKQRKSETGSMSLLSRRDNRKAASVVMKTWHRNKGANDAFVPRHVMVMMMTPTRLLGIYMLPRGSYVKGGEGGCCIPALYGGAGVRCCSEGGRTAWRLPRHAES